METLVNSRIATFDSRIQPSSDPLLTSVGVDNFAMIRILNDNCPEFAVALNKGKIQNIKAVDICEGRGFLSHILRTSIQFVDPKQPSFSFVIKVPQSETFNEIVDSFSGSAGSIESESSSASSSTDSICSTHNTECDFYELFNSCADMSMVLPKVYYTRHNSDNHKGMIFMEDLSGRGSCVDVFSSLTTQQCVNVAKEIARLQAHFSSMSETQQSMIADEECVHTAHYKQHFLDEFLSKIGNYGQEFVDLLDKLQRFANTRFAKYVLIDRVKGESTLVHGDLWTNNVLFKKNQDESVSDELCALIDWQTAFQGNPLFDLSFLLASSTDANVRREISTEVVDIYFDTLVQIYKQQQKELKMTRDQAHTLFKLCQIQQAPVLGALMCLFGQKMELSCPDKTFLHEKMAVICERTKHVMQDAVEYAKELDI